MKEKSWQLDFQGMNIFIPLQTITVKNKLLYYFSVIGPKNVTVSCFFFFFKKKGENKFFEVV